jgi:uncharacterized membrane protein
LITNDAIVLGILFAILAWVFTTSSSESPRWKRFYTFVPPILLCYFLPGVASTLGIISGEESKLYFVSSRYLLPTSLALLTLSVDLRGIARLGFKAVVMFLAGTVGVLLGGPFAILVVSAIAPEIVGGHGPDAVWAGMATIAGSWIGGSANQAAMKEVWKVGDQLFSAMIAVDVLVGNVWTGVLLYSAGHARAIDARNKANTEAIDALQERVEKYQAEHARIPTLPDTMRILGVGFGITAAAHLAADGITRWMASLPQHLVAKLEHINLTSSFFWIVVVATICAILLSNTRLRHLEDVGASRIGSALLYVLIASIGMRMDLLAITEQPGLFAVGGIWILFHIALLLIVARLIRAPFFFVAVGSQANIGGAASAPVVASAFHPALAPVGVLLAVLGYAIGTLAAHYCAILMRAVAPA